MVCHEEVKMHLRPQRGAVKYNGMAGNCKTLGGCRGSQDSGCIVLEGRLLQKPRHSGRGPSVWEAAHDTALSRVRHCRR
jgi:hypothetical protein